MERKITIEAPVAYREDYQLGMLCANQIEGLLKIRGQGVNGTSHYDYDVSGKISVKAMYERANIQSKDIVLFINQFINVIREVEKYLLNIHCVLLSPEYIFYEDDQFYFCYYPLVVQDVWEEFHTLTEYFVKQADYKDQECVQMVFALHKGSMEDNYSLEKIAAEVMNVKSEDTYEEWRKERMEERNREETYDTQEHDWIAEQELGSSIMEETENMWTPVKRFLSRHKKPKWGDFDGLYIEEEEL